VQESRRKLGLGSAVRPGDDDGLEGPWNIPLCITRPRFAFGWLEAGWKSRPGCQASEGVLGPTCTSWPMPDRPAPSGELQLRLGPDV
jgi:hypothetical protein